MTGRFLREAQGVKTLLTDLRANGWKCWRIETRQASGIPDIVAQDPSGKLVWIECKKFLRFDRAGRVTYTKLRPAQRAFAEQCVKGGVNYAVAVVGAPFGPVLFWANVHSSVALHPSFKQVSFLNNIIGIDAIAKGKGP